MRRDIFRPSREPARTLYDAFQKEAAKRDGRSYEEWRDAEEEAVWRAAIKIADERSLRPPTRDEVRQAALYAQGHVDFGAKFAYGVLDAMRRPEKKAQRLA